MKCNEFREKVADLFDKTIDMQTQAELDEHMKSCPECKSYYDELRETFNMLQPISSEKIKGEKEKKAVADSSSQSEGAGGTIFILRSSFMKVAAIFIAVLLITGVAFAAIRFLTPEKTEEVPVPKEPEHQMLMAFFMPDDASEWHKKHLGDAIWVWWGRGTWVQNGDDSFIEEHPICKAGYAYQVKHSIVKLNGKVLDIHHLPNLPASAMRKVEIRYEDGRQIVNLITTPVQIPAGIKGNINPELTILLTCVPPKENQIKSSIYIKHGMHDSFDWKQYQYTSWTSKVENIGNYLEEVAIRKDHHVRVNVCRGVSQKHIDRIKQLIQENGVTNYELVRQ